MENSFLKFIQQHNMTQKEAARQLRVTPEHLNRIMNGGNPYTWNLVGRIFYFWHIKKNFTGALDVASSIASHIAKCEND